MYASPINSAARHTIFHQRPCGAHASGLFTYEYEDVLRCFRHETNDMAGIITLNAAEMRWRPRVDLQKGNNPIKSLKDQNIIVVSLRHL